MPWILLIYPLLAHLAVWLHDARLRWLALVWLLVIALWQALRQRRLWAWIALIAGAIALYAIARLRHGMVALYLPPILIPLMLLSLFAGSLRRGATPLVTRMAEAMRGEPLPAELRTYTRRVTWLWCAVSTALLISATVTAVWASDAIWSLATNLIHYLVLGAVFVLEFFYRRVRYGKLEHWTLMQYLRRLGKVRLRN